MDMEQAIDRYHRRRAFRIFSIVLMVLSWTAEVALVILGVIRIEQMSPYLIAALAVGLAGTVQYFLVNLRYHAAATDLGELMGSLDVTREELLDLAEEWHIAPKVALAYHRGP